MKLSGYDANESSFEPRLSLLGLVENFQSIETEKVGIAFQIKDDTFDFGTDNVGKPLGIDIKEKKVTLPLIYALNSAEKPERKRIINLVKNHQDDPVKIQQIIDFVNGHKGVYYANEKMLQYQNEAFDILNQFDAGEARTGLEQLVLYTTERKK